MKKYILSIVILTTVFTISCGGEKSEEKEGVDIDAQIQKMCECFQEGKNDSQKFMECSEENAKVRESLKSDNDALTKYDGELAKCIQ